MKTTYEDERACALLTRVRSCGSTTEQLGVLTSALGVSMPLDIDQLVAAFAGCWLVVRDPVLPVSGLTSWNPTSKLWVSCINASEPITRQRFSVLHELKHIIDHTNTSIKGLTPEAIEARCDDFAAQALMPEALMKQLWEDERSLERIAEYCFVSVDAVRVRLGVLGLLPPMERRSIARKPRPDLYLRSSVSRTDEVTLLEAFSRQGQPLESSLRADPKSAEVVSSMVPAVPSSAFRMRDCSMLSGVVR